MCLRTEPSFRSVVQKSASIVRQLVYRLRNLRRVVQAIHLSSDGRELPYPETEGDVKCYLAS
jgi:hypothetical protein